MKSKKIRVLLQIMCIFAVLLCGCAAKDAQPGSSDGEAADSNTVLVYCTNAEGTKLTSFPITTQGESFDGIVKLLTENFSDPKGEEYVSLLRDGTKINEYVVGVDNVTVDFNAAYLGLSNVNEILLRAGIVKTLVQIPGVLYVQITVEGQPITEENGDKIGPMDDETFIDNKGNSINSYRNYDMNLYFPDESGKMLKAEKRVKPYSSNVPVEKMIVEQIIAGPATAGNLAVTSQQVGINSVSTADGLCVIDLDNNFNQTDNELVTPEMCLYSFVNSIIEQTDVEEVRFMIDGKSDVRFRGQINLDQSFTMDPRLTQPAGEETAGEEETEKETKARKKKKKKKKAETETSAGQEDDADGAGEGTVEDSAGNNADDGSDPGVGVEAGLDEEN